MSDDDAPMPRAPVDRRAFLAASAVGLAACAAEARGARAPFTGEGVEAVDERTLREAEKLLLVRYTASERALILADLESFRSLFKDLRSIAFPNAAAPASLFDPRAGLEPLPKRASSFRVELSSAELPKDEAEIAFAPVARLAAWIRERKITSERLTSIYLRRLETIGARLECVITLTRDLALQQARAADVEIAAGKYRGPLHGVPWGAKDLLDTKGIATTWGAKPFAGRVPDGDATVVKRLADAGAVLVAKLSLGELAKDDVWFGGRTKNPWNVLEGSGGSSAGPGAATSAGLVGFAIGSETLGSIVSPSMRCGVVGLRPTFGRVPRTGAMALCWSLDKLGPMTRSVLDTMLVLAALVGPDGRDGLDEPLAFDASASVRGLRVGFVAKHFEAKESGPIDRAALDALRRTGVELVPIDLPELPYETMSAIVAAESAAAFADLVASKGVDLLAEQHAGAWPNFLREARFLSAVDLVQAERLRRRTMEIMHRVFASVDALVGPSFAGSMLTITNMTGHPSLTLPVGFEERAPLGQEADAPRPADAPPLGPKTRMPRGLTLWGRLFDEGTLARLGIALESELGLALRPPTTS